MKNYIQHIIELFGHNEYSLGTRRRVQQMRTMRKKKKKHSMRCGSKRENRRYPVACSSRYNGCNEI